MNQQRLERLLASLDEAGRSSSVLERICIVCAGSTSARGAGVSRLADGGHETLAASAPLASAAERLQVTLAEGPCIDAVSSFRPAHEQNLASVEAETRWPLFTPAALELGVAAAFAFPLITGGVAVGALDVYAGEPGPLDPEGWEDALLLADLAALAVDQVNGSTEIAGVGVTTEAAEAWAHGAAVHNATGMMAERLSIHVDEALLRLRAIAFVTDRTVLDVARDVLDRRLPIEPWVDDE